jgi:phosphatidylserine decarboxylase
MKPIVYFDRYQNKICQETIYGERPLRWIYSTWLGKLSLFILVKRKLFSKYYGWKMNQPSSQKKVLPFIKKYELNVDEMLDSPELYKTFNHFFYRCLKPQARPIDSTSNHCVFPADGRHFWLDNLSQLQDHYIKNFRFDLASLLGDQHLASQFKDGSALISRLCPVDYHRFHFPCDGQFQFERKINGSLFSVSPIALMQRPNLFWENKRELTVLDHPQIGRYVYLEIGATCVGGIHQTFDAGSTLLKGAEKGYFSFGGSCVILLFQKNRVKPSEDLIKASEQGLELYAKMGDVCGVC